MTLPTRTLTDDPIEHLADHNALHTRYNELGSTGAPVFDASASSAEMANQVVTWMHPMGSGGNRKVIVAAHGEHITALNATAVSATFDGQPMTLAVEIDHRPSTRSQRTSIWYIDEADLGVAGSRQVAVTFGGSNDNHWGASVSLANAAQGAPEAVATGVSTGATVSTNITTLTNNALLIDAVGFGSTGGTDLIPDGSQVQREESQAAGADTAVSTLEVAVAGAATMGWTGGAALRCSHAIVAVGHQASGVVPAPLPPDVGIYYVSEGGDDDNDGLSWSSAYRSVAYASDQGGELSEIRIGQGTFTEGTINWWHGQSFIGTGPTSTKVVQAVGLNASLFRTHPSYPEIDYFHNAAIRNMTIQGNKVDNTAGSGILFNQRVGENTLIENIIIQSFPEDNIKTVYGGQPIFWRDIHTFASAGYGIAFRRTGGDRFQGVNITGLSGDNNVEGLVLMYNAGDRKQESFSFVGVKAESHPDKQQDIFVVHGTACSVSIIGGSTLGQSGSGNSIVKILPSGGGTTNFHVNIIGFNSDYAYWIDDEQNSVQIPLEEDGTEAMFLSYRQGEALLHIQGKTRRPPYFGAGLSIPETMTAPLAWAGHATLHVDVDGDLAVLFGDGVAVKVGVHP